MPLVNYLYHLFKKEEENPAEEASKLALTAEKLLAVKIEQES